MKKKFTAPEMEFVVIDDMYTTTNKSCPPNGGDAEIWGPGNTGGGSNPCFELGDPDDEEC